MEPARESKLQIHKSGDGEIQFLRFVGTIDEDFDGRGVAKGLDKGYVIIALGEIRRITSFGVRQWVQFVTEASKSCEGIYYIECAPRVIDQFNMIANFAAEGTLVSFYAPFRCYETGQERLQLVQVDRDREMLESGELKGQETAPGVVDYLDDDPETFLLYVRDNLDIDIPHDVATFLSNRSGYAMPAAARKVRVEKRVDKRTTGVVISGDLDQSLPVDKIAEGLEGDVVLDLSGVGRVAPLGRGQWRVMMHQLAPQTERVAILGMPAAMLEQLSRRDDLADKAQVLTVYLPYVSPATSVTSQLLVDVGKYHDLLVAGQAPELKSPDSDDLARCIATPEMLRGASELPKPAPEWKHEKLREWLRKQTKKKKVARAGEPMVVAAAPGAGRWVLAGLGLLGVGLAALALFFAIGRNNPRRNVLDTLRVIAASAKKAPAWVKKDRFVEKGANVMVIGESGLTTSKARGFELAKNAVYDEVAYQVALRIGDRGFSMYVAKQFQVFRQHALSKLEKASDVGDARGALEKIRQSQGHVAKALAKSASFFQPKRIDTYWEKVDTGSGTKLRVWARYRASATVFKRMIKHYSRRVKALDTEAVAAYPGLGWRYPNIRGVVIVNTGGKSPLKTVGVLLGDLISGVGDRRVETLDDFKRVMNQVHASLRKTGGVMMLKVRRGGGPVQEHRVTVAKKKVKTIIRYRRTSPYIRRRNPNKLPPGNIWDDNPYE